MANERNDNDTKPAELLDIREKDRSNQLDAMVQKGADLLDQQDDLFKQINDYKKTGFGSENPEYKRLNEQLQSLNNSFEQLGKEWADLRRNWIPGDSFQEDTFERKAIRAQKKRDNAREELAESEKERSVKLADIKGLPKGMSAERQEVALTFDSYMLEKGTALMAAQNLLDARLQPFNLTLADEKQEDAIRAVLPPSLANGILVQLSKGQNSPEYASAMETLKKLQDSISKPYDEIRKLYLPKAKLQESAIANYSVDKLSDIGHRLTSNPTMLVSAGVFTVSLVALLWGKKTDGITGFLKKTLPWLGLIGGGAVVGNAVIKSVRKGNDGPSDWLKDKLGFQVDDVLNPALLDELQDALGENFQNKDAADEMIRLMATPVEKCSDLYGTALKHGRKSIDPKSFLGNGVVASELINMNGEDVFTGLDWFYEQCGKRAEKEAGVTYSHDELRAQGVKWAKENLKNCKLATALVGLHMLDASLFSAKVAGGGIPQEGGSALNEGSKEVVIQDRELAELTTKYPSFKESLYPCGTGVYTIQGYPFKYNYNRNTGVHEFTDSLKNIAPISIDSKANPEALKRQLNALVADGAVRMAKQIDAKFGTTLAGMQFIDETTIKGTAYTLKYTPGGLWRFEPGLAHTKYNGLPNYKPEETVPAVLRADASDIYLGFDTRTPDAINKNYSELPKLLEDYDKKVILKALAKADTNHLLLGLSFTVNDIDNNVADKTTVSITYPEGESAGHTGTLLYKGGKLESIQLTEDAKLTELWDKQAKSKVDAFFADPDVQREFENITPELKGTLATIWHEIKGAGKWVIEDLTETKFRNDQDKQAVQAILDRKQSYLAEYKKLYGTVTSGTLTCPTAESFATNEQALIQPRLGTWFQDIRNGVVLATVKPQEKAAMQVNDATEAKRIVDTKGTEAIRRALAPVRGQELTKNTTFRNLFSNAWNTISVDSTRKDQYDKIEKDFMQSLLAEVGALGFPTTDKEIQNKIDAKAKDAYDKATAYWGLDNKEAVEAMMLEPLKGNEGAPNYEAWKEATVRVANYLTGNIKWEKYIVFSNPENMARVMKLWYDNIDNAKVELELADHPMATANAYADYFLWQVSIRMGGHRDYSPDRLYDNGGVFSNSDSQFNDEFGSLSREFQTYADWSTNVITPKIEGETSDKEVYAKIVRERFNAWFDTYADCGALLKLDAAWPAVFKGIVNKKLENVIANSTTTDLGTRIEHLKDFVIAERMYIFEPMMLHKVEHSKYGFDLETTVFDQFDKYFWGQTVNNNLVGQYDLVGYQNHLKESMLANNIVNKDGILTNFYDSPNWLNIPYITLRGAPTLP